MALIVCRDVSLGYDGVTVCEHLNFEVNSGDYLCIVGDNGSGKSTLMKALLGLNPTLKGEIIKGEGMTVGSIGYLPQQSELQRDFPATVREVVLSGCVGDLGKRFFYGKAARKLALECMEKLGISALADKPYSILSGGQQQRALLARALCAAKKVILLDEPVSGLDPVAASEMYALIDSLRRKSDITVIMVTHDIGAAVKYASCVLHMGERPEFFGSVSGYRQSSAFPISRGADDE